jgi:hypothetical protein
MNLNLTEAFGRFGARPSTRLGTMSAMATDGAMVLACSHGFFRHPAEGVLRYEDKLSRVGDSSKDTELLSRHLTLALDGALPVRMVVATLTNARNDRRTRSFHVRPDLIGKVVKFDGDHFIVDFTRMEVIRKEVTGKRK